MQILVEFKNKITENLAFKTSIVFFHPWKEETQLDLCLQTCL